MTDLIEFPLPVYRERPKSANFNTLFFTNIFLGFISLYYKILTYALFRVYIIPSIHLLIVLYIQLLVVRGISDLAVFIEVHIKFIKLIIGTSKCYWLSANLLKIG